MDWQEQFDGIAPGSPALGMLAAGGLGVLMTLGVAVRIRVRDPLPQLLPAAAYPALSFWLLKGYA